MKNVSLEKKQLIKNAEIAVNALLQHCKKEMIESENEHYIKEGSIKRISYDQHPAPEAYFIELSSTSKVVFGTKEMQLQAHLNTVKNKIEEIEEELKESDAPNIELMKDCKALREEETIIICEINELNFKPAS